MVAALDAYTQSPDAGKRLVGHLSNAEHSRQIRQRPAVHSPPAAQGQSLPAAPGYGLPHPSQRPARQGQSVRPGFRLRLLGISIGVKALLGQSPTGATRSSNSQYDLPN
jgi:hypothetical protein